MSDLALKGLGLACAAGSVWFAVHMVSHQEAGPRINALEDFAIFAQPNRGQAIEAAVRAAATEGQAPKAGRAVAIDMTPIGSAASRPGSNPSLGRPEARIVELNDEGALLETREGYRRVRVGDSSPEVGKVISIRKIGDYWVVIATERSLAQIVPSKEQTDPRRP